MTHVIRGTAAAGAICALLAGGTVAGPASADTAPSAECDTATALVVTARADVVTARHAFTDSRRPMGVLVAAERRAAPNEARTSRIAIGELRQEAQATDDRAVRRALLAEVRSERADLRDSLRLLRSERAVVAEVRADRLAAEQAFAAARAARRDAQAAADVACGETTEPTEPSDTGH